MKEKKEINQSVQEAMYKLLSELNEIIDDKIESVVEQLPSKKIIRAKGEVMEHLKNMGCHPLTIYAIRNKKNLYLNNTIAAGLAMGYRLEWVKADGME